MTTNDYYGEAFLFLVLRQTRSVSEARVGQKKNGVYRLSSERNWKKTGVYFWKGP